MPSQEAPSYSSARVQRATRINNIEAARLQQRLQYIEKAKLHQCRLANQDMRLISLSIDYIQASSGHSPEAWRPETQKGSEEIVDEADQGPLFMYGERIVSRKKRRMPRPMSAVERSSSMFMDHSSIADESVTSDRPKSSPGKPRPTTSMGFLRVNASFDSDTEAGSSEHDGPTSSRPSTSASRVTPRQDWGEDTSEMTKKILRAQERSQSGKRSVYQSAEEVMSAQASRHLRGLARKTRISSAVSTSSRPTSSISRHSVENQDFAPKRPPDMVEGLGRRATFGEILNQRRPTMNAGAWRSHLSQTSATPMSTQAHSQMLMSAKKMINDSRLERVNERVQSFISGDRNPPRRAQSARR
ncbi:uncharacterized protein LOC101855188 [Aplysia californica]|uniref:Uncharacterized protein LOC101855188 n=1 Tax=Aplysia californica TaxID=6500 RepID=A0ABM0JP40_APLCA|nr:uncharacterized protein LOC101855188 [Aplysia californica]